MSSTYLYSDNDTTYDMSVSSTGTVLSYTDITTRVPLPSIQANANKYLKVRNDGLNLEWDDVQLGSNVDIILDERTTSNPPSILFADTNGTEYNTGINMYRDTTNANNQTISLYCNNTKKLDIAENRIISKEEILGVNGTASVPSYSFESDTNTGIYRPNSFQVGIACNGGITANFTTTTVDFGSAGNSREVNVTGSLNATGWCRTGNGTAALPVFTFTADQDCGMYRVASNQVGISAGGVLSTTFTSTGVDIPGTLTNIPVNISTGDYNWNNLAADAYLMTTTGGNINFQLNVSGGLTSIGRKITFYKQNTNNSITFSTAATAGTVRLTINSGTQAQTSTGTAVPFTHVPTNSGRTWLFQIVRTDANNYQLTSLSMTDGTNTFQQFDLVNANIFRAGDGTISIPSYSFNTDTDTGMYMEVSGNRRVRFPVDGVDRLILSNSGTASIIGRLTLDAGSVSAPSLFFGDSDTGIYSTAGDVINFATNATQRMRIDNTGVSITAPFKPSDLIQYSVSTQLTADFNTNTLTSHFIRVSTSGGDVTITLGNVGAGSHFTIFKETTSNAILITNNGAETYNGATRTGFSVIPNSNRGIISLYQVSSTSWFGAVSQF